MYKQPNVDNCTEGILGGFVGRILDCVFQYFNIFSTVTVPTFVLTCPDLCYMNVQ